MLIRKIKLVIFLLILINITQNKGIEEFFEKIKKKHFKRQGINEFFEAKKQYNIRQHLESKSKFCNHKYGCDEYEELQHDQSNNCNHKEKHKKRYNDTQYCFTKQLDFDTVQIVFICQNSDAAGVLTATSAFLANLKTAGLENYCTTLSNVMTLIPSKSAIQEVQCTIPVSNPQYIFNSFQADDLTTGCYLDYLRYYNDQSIANITICDEQPQFCRKKKCCLCQYDDDHHNCNNHVDDSYYELVVNSVTNLSSILNLPITSYSTNPPPPLNTLCPGPTCEYYVNIPFVTQVLNYQYLSQNKIEYCLKRKKNKQSSFQIPITIKEKCCCNKIKKCPEKKKKFCEKKEHHYKKKNNHHTRYEVVFDQR